MSEERLVVEHAEIVGLRAAYGGRADAARGAQPARAALRAMHRGGPRLQVGRGGRWGGHGATSKPAAGTAHWTR